MNFNHLPLFCFFLQGRGLKIDDILKDDEVLTAFLLRDAELSESIVYQLVNAKIRLEQVTFGTAAGCSDTVPFRLILFTIILYVKTFCGSKNT